MPKVLLIDDEPPACDILRALLADHPEATVAGEAGTVAEARAVLADADYDLVFLDIQLRGGSGFDLVPLVRAGARIIFVTADDRQALRAFEVNALDYLVKPVSPARLAEALRRAGAVPPAAASPVSALRPDDIVQVKTGPGAARFLRVADIVLITSQTNYSELLLADGERLLVRQTLAGWESRLPREHFLRVHRQTIVSLPRLTGYRNADDEIALLHIEGVREPVRARRQHWPELIARLAALGIRL